MQVAKKTTYETLLLFLFLFSGRKKRRFGKWKGLPWFCNTHPLTLHSPSNPLFPLSPLPRLQAFPSHILFYILWLFLRSSFYWVWIRVRVRVRVTFRVRVGDFALLHPSPRMYADRVEAGAKRSVYERLNGTSLDDSGRRRQFTGKRFVFSLFFSFLFVSSQNSKLFPEKSNWIVVFSV